MAAKDSNTNEATIYVCLIDEGTQVWRPVKAELIGNDQYRIVKQEVPDDEIWEFQPGDIVRVRKHVGSTDDFLVAISKVHE